MNEMHKHVIKPGTVVKVCRDMVFLTRDLFATDGDEVLVLTDTVVPFFPNERYELCEFVGIFEGKISIMSMYRHEFKIFEEF